ncbi:flagellar filament capping protein FliD [Wansuia hejianensis]|uniref:Flagellar hook-associated protein 2 n=1 Tax=Wansuia hejianensis TaxID=2763667 RepID=A0A926IMD0_9FIRM|nr:flagellar filament capping protein FliD [Wansuia hejianensis]MBC8590310.1 flagellar filament capping protein FliD [Wansuia hejianensis]
MAGINFMGSYSGIDKSMIDDIMKAEKMPLVQLANKKTSITDKQNAWKDINTRLNSLYEKLKELEKQSTFTSKVATSTNDKIVTMNVGTGAPEGSYNIKVEQLATSTSIIGNKIEGLVEGKFAKGTFAEDAFFTITNNEGKEISIEVSDGDSLQSIAKKINDALTEPVEEGKTGQNIGIKATIVDGRIVLTDEKTGERGITLHGAGETLEKLGLDGFEGTTNNGVKAEFTINGVDVTSDSNKITDVIEGVTINLHKAHAPGEEDTVTVSLDTEKATKAVQDFVDQYNSTMKFIEEKMAAGDPEVPGSRGTLSGDGALMRLHSSLRNMVTKAISSEEGVIKDISQLGVSTVDRYGQLHFDSTKLVNALAENPNKVIDFFKGEEGKEGYSSLINKQIDYYISNKKDEHGRTGIIKSTMDSYDNVIKDLNRQIENFNERMERKEQYYIKVFTALDVAMMQAESQMSWLEGQINAMNGMTKKK